MTLRPHFMAAMAFTLVAAGLVLVARPAGALTLIPPSMEINVEPGLTETRNIKLFNEEAQPISLFTSVSNFVAKDEEGNPDFDFAAEQTDLASWIDIGGGPFTLQPQDKLEIPYTVTVPADAEPGGHYASIFFGSNPNTKAQEEGGQVNIRSLVGMLLIMRVAGDIQEQASVSSFTANSVVRQSDDNYVTGPEKKRFNRLPAGFAIRVQNTGNVHVRPQGTIVIKNMFGGTTAEISANDVKGAVLPDSIRRFDVFWRKAAMDSAPAGFFGEFKAEWQNFALGTYTATATVTYGQTGQTLQAVTKVTIIPWRILTILLVLILTIVLILTVGVKRYNANIIRHAQQRPPPVA